MSIASKARLFTPALRRGALIKELRVKRGLYQADVAAWINEHGYNINMTQKRISSLESGSDFRGSEIYAIADCFGIDVEELRCF